MVVLHKQSFGKASAARAYVLVDVDNVTFHNKKVALSFAGFSRIKETYALFQAQAQAWLHPLVGFLGIPQ